jgi:uncharacterized heparinase superfamily protein
MPIKAEHQSGAGSQVRLGHELRRLFEEGVFNDDGLLVQRQWHPLPDFRLSVQDVGLELLQGRTPAHTGLGNFDPFLGPFSIPSAINQCWTASFEFLRDLSPSYGDLIPILELWLDQWFIRQTQEPQSGLAKWKAASSGPSRTDALIWRGRRVINWLAHLLPLMPALSPNLQGRIWHGLLVDIGRLIEPDRRFLASLAGGLEPLSRRAIWTKAFALLGVSSSAPELLRQATIAKALDRVEELIAPDGMFVDGSPLGTLSAAADLAMLTRVVEADPVNQRVRQALATLQRSDGSLVTFSKQRGYGGLVKSVLGPGRWRRASVLKSGHIGLIEAGPVRIWMRTPSGPSETGPVCEVESGGVELFSNSSFGLSALMFDRSLQMFDPQIRRRDEDGQALLESKVSFEVDGHLHSHVRTMKISRNGRFISGEDALFARVSGARLQSLGLLFDLGEGCIAVESRDGQSILIRTPMRNTWRFRSSGLDTIIKESSDVSSLDRPLSRRLQLLCMTRINSAQKDVIMRWDLMLEDLD